ncbi:hypothetical protein [Sphingomonas sp. S2M10]|uniref:hypothetical protein n=1 Tax=Sphingomonas sp. S2M10 TaxID=2705010 RepID=UPI001457016B|nr:hypothetical protein [Sphingomonas sp. S2M10]
MEQISPHAIFPLTRTLLSARFWSETNNHHLIVHKQYRLPARWWHLGARFAGLAMIAIAIGWPIMLLVSGWTLTGVLFAVADGALLATGYELMKAGGPRWL